MIGRPRAGEKLDLEADVVVIGAGTAGLPMAARLAAAGLSVICLESGGESQTADEHPLNEVVHAKWRYDGAAHGRFRCLGGTSTRWGGALVPFLAADLDAARWPIAHAEIVRWAPEVERFFGLSGGPYEIDDPALATPGFVARLAKWPPFARRNVVNLTRAALAEAGGPRVLLDATVTELVVEDGRLARVVARSSDGGEVVARAREFVFAAGAIETTRLLLPLDRQNGERIFAPDDQLGRCFGDHVSVVVADVETRDRAALNRLAGFRFEAGGAMRNLRFEMAETSPSRATIPPCFAHIAFETDEASGFGGLREVFRHLQQRRPPPPAALARLARNAPWLAKAVWWRFVEKRLLYPADAAIKLHMVTEQVESRDNRITLSADRVDAFGLPLAEIAWEITEADADNIARATEAFARGWEDSPLARVGTLRRRPREEISRLLADSGGIFHPVGSTRMGASPETGVVDADLRPFRLRNATVLATSVLPGSGGANPTMMLMMLAFRAADRLTRELRAG